MNHSKEKNMRYLNDRELNQLWRSAIESELKSLIEEMVFFEDFQSRQWSEFDVCDGADQIINMIKKRKKFLEESLEAGDYINA